MKRVLKTCHWRRLESRPAIYWYFMWLNPTLKVWFIHTACVSFTGTLCYLTVLNALIVLPRRYNVPSRHARLCVSHTIWLYSRNILEDASIFRCSCGCYNNSKSHALSMMIASSMIRVNNNLKRGIVIVSFDFILLGKLRTWLLGKYYLTDTYNRA